MKYVSRCLSEISKETKGFPLWFIKIQLLLIFRKKRLKIQTLMAAVCFNRFENTFSAVGKWPKIYSTLPMIVYLRELFLKLYDKKQPDGIYSWHLKVALSLFFQFPSKQWPLCKRKGGEEKSKQKYYSLKIKIKLLFVFIKNNIVCICKFRLDIKFQ